MATALEPFKVLETRRETHIAAAGIRRAARARGVTAGTIDCLIAAVTIEWGATLLTADRDFDHLAAAAGLRLEMAIVR